MRSAWVVEVWRPPEFVQPLGDGTTLEPSRALQFKSRRDAQAYIDELPEGRVYLATERVFLDEADTQPSKDMSGA